MIIIFFKENFNRKLEFVTVFFRKYETIFLFVIKLCLSPFYYEEKTQISAFTGSVIEIRSEPYIRGCKAFIVEVLKYTAVGSKAEIEFI